jgi:peptidyl-prolyl cis-trans isomerase-like protein 2
VFGKVVGGLDVLSRIEAVETDKKDRPKTSIKIEDCLVFVDPYAEIDEQLKNERMNATKKEEKKEVKETQKTLNDMKPQRAGIGKYINSNLFEKKHKMTAADEEDKVELKSKKLKSGSSTFGDFSAW